MTEPLPVSTAPPLFVVLNAASGSQDADEAREQIATVFRDAGREHAFFTLDQTDDALRRACAEGGVVVAAGGDGTINAVAQRLLGHDCAFGVIPQGTFNYFAREHGVPLDTIAAASALLRATPQPVQAGLVNDRIFLVNASLGLYPKLLEDREDLKAQLGRSRFVAFLSGLRTLVRERGQLRLTLELDGSSRTLRTPTLFVGNNALQLQRLGFAEAAALESGWLAAIVLRPTGTLAMLGLVLRGALGRLGEADQVSSLAIRTLTVSPRGKPRIKVATDGEVSRMRAPLVFRVAPQPLMLMVPAPDDRVDAK
jgi:diacylglycerol kinase family enzyme